MYIYNKVYVALAAMVAFCLQATAQQKIENPKIDYSGAPKEVRIGGIAVSGVQGYDDFVLTSISGLSVGQTITLPGSEVTNAVKRYWKHGMFSEVSIAVDSIVGNEAFLHIHLNMRPRISVINYVGMKKSEREDLEKKIGIMKGGQLTPHMLDRAKLVVKRYFDDKGFKNADIEINRRDDVANKNQLILDVIVDKKEKIKVRNIIIEGNNNISDKKLKGNLFKKGAFAKTHEAGKLSNLFKSKKFTPENWESDKKNLIDKYNEYGYRDAVILKDSVWNVDDKHVNVYVKVDEGKKYYVRNITWVGNTVYSTDYLSRLLDFEKGDVYNQKLLSKRLTEDEDAVGNVYWNNGYLFYNLQPTEVNIVGDSIDLEMRIFEGQQAHINHVRINGNDRLYENVVRRELRTKPGDLFSKEALQRSARELASMGHFDPEAVSPDVKPNYEDGTVDINWDLKQKSNDQVELSLGWGQTGIIGRVGLKFTNWSMRNLFRKNKEHRGILPIGDGETLSLGVQTNGRYYQSYNVSYSTAWFGGKRPIQFSVGAYYSKYTSLSDNYYNSGMMNNYWSNYYGNGSSYYNNYESYYDPDKYIRMLGLSVGWGKRLRWPDDYFTLSLQLGYTRYMMKNWNYLMITNGASNNLNLSISLNRMSSDNQLFPRRGSEFSVSLTLTPPWSKWDGKDYEHLATDPNSVNYQKEMKEKFRWVEYHKWKFRSKTYTALTSGQRCLVLMTRVEFGLLGSYNKYKKSPFETFYVGGDGMSGTSYGYSEEAGNAWYDTNKFNPFDMKRSAGVGVRIFLPMVGLMGIDWAYGFDKVYNGGSYKKGGSQFHFILGQEF